MSDDILRSNIPFFLQRFTFLFFFITYIYVNIYLFIYFSFVFGCAGYLLLCLGFSLVAVSEGYSPVAVFRLLVSVVPLVWSPGSWAHELQ